MLHVDVVALCCCVHKVGQFVCPPHQIFRIKDAFSQTPKESRHAILQDFAARAKQGSVRIELASERDEVALVSTGAVQKQQRALRAAGNEFVNEIRLWPHDLSGTWIGGRILSISDRADSSQGGRHKWLPRSSSFSSKVKPGGSVAISKSTPPGSRK